MDNTAGQVLWTDKLQKIRKTPVFNPVSFSLLAGEGMGVFGHNGCGKTTLLDILAGLQKAERGEYSFCGPFGYVMQQDGFQNSLSCYDNLLLEAALCGFPDAAARQRVMLSAEQYDLLPFLKKRLSRCSAGMRARLAIAAAMLPSPKLLLLDEAFAALDEKSQKKIISLLKEHKSAGMSIVMVSHTKTDFDGLCERVLLLPEAKEEFL